MDSSSHFPFIVWTHTHTHKVADTTNHPTYPTLTVYNVGNNQGMDGPRLLPVWDDERVKHGIQSIYNRANLEMCTTCPPAAHAVTSAKRPPSLISRLAAVVTSRTPVAPNGWPIDNEPPQVFSFSIGSTPNCVHINQFYLWHRVPAVPDMTHCHVTKVLPTVASISDDMPMKEMPRIYNFINISNK